MPHPEVEGNMRLLAVPIQHALPNSFRRLAIRPMPALRSAAALWKRCLHESRRFGKS